MLTVYVCFIYLFVFHSTGLENLVPSLCCNQRQTPFYVLFYFSFYILFLFLCSVTYDKHCVEIWTGSLSCLMGVVKGYSIIINVFINLSLVVWLFWYKYNILVRFDYGRMWKIRRYQQLNKQTNKQWHRPMWCDKTGLNEVSLLLKMYRHIWIKAVMAQLFRNTVIYYSVLTLLWELRNV